MRASEHEWERKMSCSMSPFIYHLPFTIIITTTITHFHCHHQRIAHSETCSYFDDAQLKCKSRNKTVQIMWFARKTNNFVILVCFFFSLVETGKRERERENERKMYAIKRIKWVAEGREWEISSHDDCSKSHVYVFSTILSLLLFSTRPFFKMQSQQSIC